MASFQALALIDNASYMLNRLNFFAIRDRDNKGRPVAKSRWTIMLSLYAVKDVVFTEWMIDPTKKRDIEIHFINGDETTKKWQFQKVYCVGFEENFVDDLGIMETIIILSGEAVTNGNSTITYDWGA